MFTINGKQHTIWRKKNKKIYGEFGYLDSHVVIHRTSHWLLLEKKSTVHPFIKSPRRKQNTTAITLSSTVCDHNLPIPVVWPWKKLYVRHRWGVCGSTIPLPRSHSLSLSPSTSTSTYICRWRRSIAACTRMLWQQSTEATHITLW